MEAPGNGLLTKSEIQRYRPETSKEVIINADRALFAQMMIIALPSSPLGPCSADGSLWKPNKVSLAKELQKKKYDSCWNDSTVVRTNYGRNGNDPENKRRPENICWSSWTFDVHGLNEGTDSQRIDVVFDVYRDNSIKNPETRKRGS